MAEYHAGDFGWDTRAEENSAESAPERMPAVPSVEN